MPDRRGFLSTLGVATAAAALPGAKIYEDAQQPQAAMPDASLFERDEEAYWTAIRRQFLIPDDEVYLNNGTVGSSPMPVLKAIIDCYQNTERMAQSEPEDYPIWDMRRGMSFATLWRNSLDAIATNWRCCATRRRRTATLQMVWT